MSDLEPMDAELARLFEEERASQVPEPIARREVLARVEKSLLLATLAAGAVQGGATGAGASAAATGLTSNLAKLKIALLLGAAGTFAAGVAVGRSTAPSPTPAVSSTPVAMVTGASGGASASSLPLVALTSAAPLTSAPSSEVLPTGTSAAPSISASATPGASDDLPKEQALLDTARAALARGRADDALAAVASHASTFPRGRLVEDREALAVQAHAAAGHPDEARKRAERFRTRYPKSIYLPAIDRALARL